MKGRPKKNQTLTTLETLDPKEVQEEALQTMVDEGQKMGLYEELHDQTNEIFKADIPVVKELKEVAISVFRNPKTNRWAVATVKFDYITGTFGKVDIIEESTERIEVLERARVQFADHFMKEVY